MAKKYKQKKKRMKKYKGTYVTADRLDMSKGGRVTMANGGSSKYVGTPGNITLPGGAGADPNLPPRTRTQETPKAPELTPASDEAMRETEGEGLVGEALTAQQRAARQERIRETGLQIEAASTGDVPDAAKIPAAQQVGVDIFGKPLQEQVQKETVMEEPTEVTETTAEQVAKEAVTTVAEKDIEEGVVDKQITAATFNAIVKNQPANVQAAIQNLTPEVRDRITAKVQGAALESPTKAAEIAQAEISAALTPEVRGSLRAVSTVPYIAPKEAVEVAPVDEAEVTTRVAQTISEKQKTDILENVTGEGVDLNNIPQYELVKQRTAQVAEANTKIAQELGTAPSEDAATREGITSDGVAKGDAAQIGGIPTFQAASRQAVTGTARTTAAADMLAVVGELPPEVTAAVIEDPATVEAKIDTEPVNVIAAVAALPKEALVSSQMENLLAGIEDNKTPVWARPAVDAVNQMMAQRGLSASTVGRDALFNAIIQSALPIAQSNATALQQRASQNLSNEQQANLQQASQVMQQRMTNLSNQQTAASQTAQMAQQIVLKQGEFDQQAVLTTAQQEQQVRMTNIQNEQQKASQESSQRQQMALANLDVGSKMDLANLEQINAANRESMSADQQGRLAEYQAKVNRTMRQAELNQRMEEVNLDSRLKVELANLAELNTTNRASMSNDQQMRLANLNVLVDFKKTNASLAQQMDLANMSAENQIELANLQEKAAADSANFTEANKFRLQELTTTASFLSQNAEIRQRAEMAKLGSEEKIALANLTAKNQADSESMTAENQMELANLNKRMAAAQTNAQLAQQLGLAELSNDQQAAMFNAQIGANMDMANFNVEQQKELSNSKFMQTVQIQNMNAEQQAIMQNATAMASLDLANLSTQERLQVENAKNFLAMDMANLNNEQQANMLKAQQEQQRLLSDQAAQNAAAQFNATSENQTNQFMANLSQNNQQFNTSQLNSMEQFNKQALNIAEARRVGNEAEAAKLESQLKTDVSKFNSQLEAQREEFNTKNETAIAQSNVAWRRQANTADTAAQNAINQQNAQNAFGLTASAMNFLWQELRDEADFNFRRWDNEETRKTSIYTAALGNDTGAASESNWSSNLSAISTLITGWLE